LEKSSTKNEDFPELCCSQYHLGLVVNGAVFWINLLRSAETFSRKSCLKAKYSSLKEESNSINIGKNTKAQG
jgi:hypothetical protein